MVSGMCLGVGPSPLLWPLPIASARRKGDVALLDHMSAHLAHGASAGDPVEWEIISSSRIGRQSTAMADARGSWASYSL